MTNPLAGQAGGAASSVPGASTLSIEEVKAQIQADLEAKYEERMKGFQRVIGSKDERLSAFEKELQQLKSASLTPEELEEMQEQEKDQRIRELESKLELRELSTQYGDEMPYFERLLAAETAEDQLQVFRAYRESLASAAAPAAPEGDPGADDLEVPDVEPNNPRRPFSLPNGQGMTDELADRILGSFRGPQASVTQRRG